MKTILSARGLAALAWISTFAMMWLSIMGILKPSLSNTVFVLSFVFLAVGASSYVKD